MADTLEQLLERIDGKLAALQGDERAGSRYVAPGATPSTRPTWPVVAQPRTTTAQGACTWPSRAAWQAASCCAQ